MARQRAKIVGLAAITKAIKALDGIAGSLNERVQETAVAIVEHGAGVGNGDMSKALDLVKVCRKHKLNIAFIVGWFAYFGNCNINLRGNNGAGKVSLISKDSKRYRGFDVDGARANNWFDAIDNDGNRALWYQGPQPEEYNPNTIGDFAATLNRFIGRTCPSTHCLKLTGSRCIPSSSWRNGLPTPSPVTRKWLKPLGVTLKRLKLPSRMRKSSNSFSRRTRR
jgi:hypothetical protein